MNRAVISALLAASLFLPMAAQSSERSADRCVPQIVESASPSRGERSIDPLADGRRLALHVHYVRYTRHEEWCRLRAAGLSDREAVEFLLAQPRGTDLSARTLP